MQNETDINDWEIDPSLYSKLDYSVLQEILKKGEEHFLGIVNEFKEIKSKAFTIIAILLSFLGVLISSIINKVDGLTTSEYKLVYLLLLFALGVTIWAVIKLLYVLYPKERMVPGDEPKNVDYLQMSNTEVEYQEFIFLINCIEDIQHKIEKNELLLQSEIKIMEQVIKSVSVTYLVLLVVSLIIILIN